MVPTEPKLSDKTMKTSKLPSNEHEVPKEEPKPIVNGNAPTLNMTLAAYAEPNEIKIPIPYGFIAAKEWGPVTGAPVLGLHGWQDNAGTFDHLVAHLPANIHLIVMDFPGHGQSSHLPHGSLYSLMQFLIDIRRVTEHLQWAKFNILAHSLGAIVALYFSAIFPEKVEKVVSIDILNPGIRPKDNNTVRKFISCFLLDEQKEINEVDTPRTEEVALEILWKSHDGLTKDGAVPLFRRGTKKVDKGLMFTRDHRLKSFLHQPWEYDTEDSAFPLLKGLRVQLLVIVASESKIAKVPEDLQQKVRKLYMDTCPNFIYVEVPGTHFIHLVEPAIIAPYIRKFLCGSEATVN